MTPLFLEPGNLDGIVILIGLIMFGPAVLLAIIGFIVRPKNKKASKVLFILAVAYIIISFGICGTILSS